MWRVPPEGMRLLKTSTTASVSSPTFLCILSLAAAFPDSIAKKALVIATFILSSSKGTTFPFLFMTLSLPGAVVSISLMD